MSHTIIDVYYMAIKEYEIADNKIVKIVFEEIMANFQYSEKSFSIIYLYKCIQF